MNVKSLHFDMKGMIPRAAYMQQLREYIIDFGYNHLLVEFEDKFPYRNYDFMVHPDAYTKEELAALHSDQLRVIPLLQCVGHLDYMLKHPQMKHLRKNGNIYRWDMSDPQVFEVWKEQADEILEVFPDCEYFHIGADEAELDDEAEFDVYLRHVEKCADYLISRGKKVIMWHDVFIRHDLAKVRSLLPKVIVHVWFYYVVRHEQIEQLLAAGAELWSASRIQDDNLYRGMTSQTKMRKNVDDWTRAHALFPFSGHTGTIWGRSQSTYPPSATLPQSMYMIAYQGESLSAGKIPDPAEFHKKMAQWFGDETLDTSALAENFFYEPDIAAHYLHPVPVHNDIIEIWSCLNDMDRLFAYMDHCFGANFAMMDMYRAGTAPQRTTQNYLDGCRIFRERTQVLFQRIDSELGKYFPPHLLQEFKNSRFSAVLEINDMQEKELLRAQKLFAEKNAESFPKQ